MSFDRLAPHYGWMEWLLAGGKLQRMRTHWLPELPPPRCVLLAGEGHGRFLIELRRAAPEAEIVCADASSGMLSVARRRLERHGLPSARVRFERQDFLQPSGLGGPFDLVVTHFFLVCFPSEQLAVVIRGIAGAATETAHWLMADFRAPPRGLARLRARSILALMYAFFRCATRLPARTLTPPDPFLAAESFELRSRHTSEWGLLHADWWWRPGRR
ncbi:MAG: class I SAM-dependent methyltransferase [Verrucomicrobiae bacterium]|nr:class I SAM-dependent methyltransferase [Verrucomicrobiae bacterium]